MTAGEGTKTNLRAWTAGLRDQPEGVAPDDRGQPGGPGLPEIDRVAVDTTVSFAAAHANRYVASNGEDDGWDGPRPILILYTKGRRSGAIRRNPLLYLERDGSRYIIGSLGGAPNHPQWYGNLGADPNVSVRVMDQVYECTARTVTAAEREVLWPVLVAGYPMFAEYQARTDRVIPIVQLHPKG
ncbi:MAG: nitroreductase/quinone reductase family protein [Acidimicrobiales bacterium]